MNIANFEFTMYFYVGSLNNIQETLKVKQPLECLNVFLEDAKFSYLSLSHSSLFIDDLLFGYYLEVLEKGVNTPELISNPLVNDFRNEKNIDETMKIYASTLVVNSNFSHFCNMAQMHEKEQIVISLDFNNTYENWNKN